MARLRSGRARYRHGWAVALLAVALPAVAATIDVDTRSMAVADDGRCSLVEAVLAAEYDVSPGTQAGECPAGSGADTIRLQPEAVYPVSRHTWPEGLQITGELAIEVCDASICGVQMYGPPYNGGWCPWNSELLYELPNPDETDAGGPPAQACGPVDCDTSQGR